MELFWLIDREVSWHIFSPLKKQENQTHKRTSRGEHMKTTGKRWHVFLLSSRTASPAAGRLGALVCSFPWKQLPPPPQSCCCPVPGEITSSELQHTGLTGKPKGFPGVFGSRPLTFLGWCQSTALSVLVGSAAAAHWTKAQASKGQLVIYAQWAYNLITTRTNTALQGQTLLLDKHEVNNTECISFRHFSASQQKARAYTEKEPLPPLDTTQQILLSCALLLHCICYIKREKSALPYTALQETPWFREPSSYIDRQRDGSSKPLRKSSRINRERLDLKFI